MSLSENLKSHIFPAIKDEKSISDYLWSSGWKDFWKFVFLRNRGYFKRKTLNISNDFVELILMCLFMDVHYLKGLILIPLFHMMINFYQELYLTLVRNSKMDEINLPLTIINSLFVGLVVATGGLFFYQMNETYIDSTIPNILFGIRSITIFIQIYCVTQTAKISTEKRVQSNMFYIWGSTFICWTTAGLAAYVANDLVDVFLIAALFNILRILHELMFLKSIKKFLQSLGSKFISESGTKDNRKLSYLFITSLILNIISLFGISFFFTETDDFESGFIILISLTILDRLAMRPFRSLQIDFIKLVKKREFKLVRVVFRKCLYSMAALLVLFWFPFADKMSTTRLELLAVLFFLITSLFYTGYVISNRHHRVIKYFVIQRVLLLCYLIWGTSPWPIIAGELILFIIFVIQSLRISRRFIPEYRLFEVHQLQQLNPDLSVGMIEISPRLPGVWSHFFKFLAARKLRLIHVDRKIKLLPEISTEELNAVAKEFFLHINKYEMGRLSDWVTTVPKNDLTHETIWTYRYPGSWVSNQGNCANLVLSKQLFRYRYELHHSRNTIRKNCTWKFKDSFIIAQDPKGNSFIVSDQTPKGGNTFLKATRQ